MRAVDETWEKAFRRDWKREKKLVIYADCCAAGGDLSGGLEILGRLRRDGAIYLVEERGDGFQSGYEWREWVGRKEWLATTPLFE